ncbi:MAG: FtsW/RodA/SpoVE family cell cycle protein [Streptococcaceae bacterium]|jgi:rod shape determining protein RodA|nr:FtsW/RodA/SpoVE family cell cycle protein [Streptococcaceae bacterium]
MQRPSPSGLDLRIDYALILPVFLLSLIGFVALYISLSADYPTSVKSLMWQQVAWLLVGMAAAFFVMHLDSRALWTLAPILYGVGLVLMILPLFIYSKDLYLSTGAKSWIGWGKTSLFEPSELMKVAYTLFLARLIVSYRNHLKNRYLRNDLELLFRMLLATAPVIFLLIGPHMQNDFGTALVFGAIFFGMLLVSGISWRILGPIVVLILLGIATIVYMVFTKDGQTFLAHLGFRPYQSARFAAWINPFSDPQGATYQQAQSQIATATGGLFGQGTAVTNISVPVRESDMIFTTIAGAFGFLGAAFVIFLYLYLIYRMVRATFMANSQFYTFIASGLTMMLLFHVFENIGAAIGVLPLTGIPLPFLSQGGSNLISNLIGIGLILSIKYNQTPIFDRKKTRDKYRKKLEERRARTERSITRKEIS